MPKDPPTKIKVTEMSRILKAHDDSVFLIIQEGVGHKISFSDLKKSILAEVESHINNTDKKIENLSKTCNGDIANLSTRVDSQFEKYHNNLSSTISQYSKNVAQQNQLELKFYIDSAKLKLQELRKEVDDKKLQKLISKNQDISKKLELFKKDSAKKLDEILMDSNEKYKILTEAIENLEKYVKQTTSEIINDQNAINSDTSNIYNQLSNDIEMFKNQTNSNCQQLSASIDDFDVRLYGLTINDIDLNNNKIISEQIKVGDIQMLSSQLQQIENQINSKDL